MMSLRRVDMEKMNFKKQQTKTFQIIALSVLADYQNNIGNSSIEKNKSMIHEGSNLKYTPGKVKLGILLVYAMKHQFLTHQQSGHFPMP